MLATLVFTTLLSTAAFSGHPQSGDASLQKWLLDETPPHPEDNKPNEARVSLGKMLFYDPRLSGDGNMSCATCHSPLFGWSDGLPTALGNKNKILRRASPTIINTAYNKTQMWDGRKKSLEDQAMGPMEAIEEMNTNIPRLFNMITSSKGYTSAFKAAYPGEKIDQITLAKAIASYERTVISNSSPFDSWVRGDANAMTQQQVRGFKLFADKNKGNCAACHQAPNFVDNGFHNIGLASNDNAEPDVGRFTQLPLARMKGAFKTPTLRDIELSSPYFHDGSAATLLDVVKLYAKGGESKTNVSEDLATIKLNNQEMDDIVAFMQALTSPPIKVVLPVIPLD